MRREERKSKRVIVTAFAVVATLTGIVLASRAGAEGESGIALGRGSTVYVIAGGPAAGLKNPPPREFIENGPELATITITYTGAWPAQAMTAFQYAADIWETQISSSITIDVTAVWTSTLPPGALGGAGPSMYYRDFSGAPISGTWYAVALANAITGADLFAGPEIDASFSSTISNWYFGTDGNPGAGEYDFVSVALHELGHGLGFTGSMQYGAVCGGLSQGCWGWGTGFPAVYDRFTEDNSGTALIALPNNSNALGAALTSGSVFFDGPNANSANGGLRVPLYAPSPWEPGSSYAHLSEVYNGTLNALMTYSLGLGEAEHSPGPVMRGMYEDTGWTLDSPPATPSRTPTQAATKTATQAPTATQTASPTTASSPTATPTLITMTPATPSFLPLVAYAPTPVPTPKWVTIVTQTFEGVFPGSWSLVDSTGGVYQFGLSSCQVFGGAFSGWAVGGGSSGAGLGCGANYPDAATTWMIYGPFSLGNAAAAELTLKAWYDTESGGDFVRWLASPDGATYYGWQVSGASSGWVDLTLDLAAVPGFGSLMGDSSVWVALQFESDLSVNLPDGLHVDNVKVRKCTQNCTSLAAAGKWADWEPTGPLNR